MELVPILFCESVSNHLFVNGNKGLFYEFSLLSDRSWSQMRTLNRTAESIDVEIYEDNANSICKCYFIRGLLGAAVSTFDEMKRLTRDWKQITTIRLAHIKNCFWDSIEDGEFSHYDKNKDYSVPQKTMMEEVFQSLEPITLDGFLENPSSDAVIEVLEVSSDKDKVDPRIVSLVDCQTQTGKLRFLMLLGWSFWPDEWIRRLCLQEQFDGVYSSFNEGIDPIDIKFLYAVFEEFRKRPFSNHPTFTLYADADEKLKTAIKRQTKHWHRRSNKEEHYLVFLPNSALCAEIRFSNPFTKGVKIEFYSDRKEIEYRYERGRTRM